MERISFHLATVSQISCTKVARLANYRESTEGRSELVQPARSTYTLPLPRLDSY